MQFLSSAKQTHHRLQQVAVKWLMSLKDTWLTKQKTQVHFAHAPRATETQIPESEV